MPATIFAVVFLVIFATQPATMVSSGVEIVHGKVYVISLLSMRIETRRKGASSLRAVLNYRYTLRESMRRKQNSDRVCTV